jgi:succinyl-CoA synthetase beta subunit
MNIEEVAEKEPESILKITINPALGLMPFQTRELIEGLELDKKQGKEFSKITKKMYALFLDKDASLIEVNPLIITKKGELLALDAKINIDTNALFRQSDLLSLRDSSQEDLSENNAAEKGLNYISLDGDIACMVNGAGLAMATMDLIKLHGGEPANFLDVGGGATAEKVSFALKLILSNKNVKAILVNIFGGIVRCDLIAEGVIEAVKEIDVKVPVIVRLEGTNVEKGRVLLKESGLKILSASDLTDAAKKAVAAVTK